MRPALRYREGCRHTAYAQIAQCRRQMRAQHRLRYGTQRNRAELTYLTHVQDATNVGDEGGFAPSINSTTEGLDLIVAAIEVRPELRV